MGVYRFVWGVYRKDSAKVDKRSGVVHNWVAVATAVVVIVGIVDAVDLVDFA